MIRISIDLNAAIERYVKYRELEYHYTGFSLPEIAALEYVTLVYNQPEGEMLSNMISLDGLDSEDVQRKQFFEQLAIIKTRISKFTTESDK